MHTLLSSYAVHWNKAFSGRNRSIFTIWKVGIECFCKYDLNWYLVRRILNWQYLNTLRSIGCLQGWNNTLSNKTCSRLFEIQENLQFLTMSRIIPEYSSTTSAMFQGQSIDTERRNWIGEACNKAAYVWTECHHQRTVLILALHGAHKYYLG